jgi:putative hydrolase of the HAD superfamily
MRQAIVFDGDDTLWHTEWLYDDARQHARKVVEAAGLDGEAWEHLEREIDVKNVALFGHSVNRFPTSCVQAYEALSHTQDRAADPSVSAAISTVASVVFDQKAPLVADARETLMRLASNGVRLALLTKGDRSLQQRRIDESGLAPLFDLIDIVDEKTPEAITSVIQRLGVDASAALSVGNSVRSDVLPSLVAGVQPVWIDAHVWEYEQAHDGVPEQGVIEVQHLSDVLAIASNAGE